jgi:tetratricopeptide (TPR) repeat protein
MRRVTLLVLLAALLWAVPHAGAQRPLTREEAQEAIKKTDDIDARRFGAAWLGETGQMEDAPLLLNALRDKDEAVRSLAEHSLWQVWSRSGDLALDRLFKTGVEQMTEEDHRGAIRTFSEIIQKKPEFAEAWNKRATVYYLIGEYQKSLADCEEVIKRNPLHFGALSGFGLIYLQLKRPDKALEHFERALRVNPNLEQVEATVSELKQRLGQRRQGTI